MKMKPLLILGLVLGTATPFAQYRAPLTSYNVQIYRAGDSTAGIPFISVAIPVTNVTCGLMPTPETVGAIVNPSALEFDDPASTTRVCQVRAAAAFFPLTIGNGYLVTMTAFDGTAESERSNVAGPFDVIAVNPSVLRGLGVRQ